MATKLAEGKTKIIWSTRYEDVVLIESKDNITAGDGSRYDFIKDKSVFANETTCNCFSLLKKKGVLNHFLGQENERRFFALKVRMIPIELVARRLATGSYLKRHPETIEGTIFDPLIFEPFYKDDSLHDPLMVWNERIERFELYNAKEPMQQGYLFDLSPLSILTPEGRSFNNQDMEVLQDITCNAFLVLEEAWKLLNVDLVDLKIECGWTPAKIIVIADVIDNDSWRIWPGGDKTQMKDKQVYRDSKDVTAGVRKTLEDNYAWVAEATKRFLP